jgi:hypothetical protein
LTQTPTKGVSQQLAEAEQRASEWLKSTKKRSGFADVEVEEEQSKRKMGAGRP